MFVNLTGNLKILYKTMYEKLRSRLHFFQLRYNLQISSDEFANINVCKFDWQFEDFIQNNVCLVCPVGNGGRIKAKFTIVNRPESSSFITSLFEICFL